MKTDYFSAFCSTTFHHAWSRAVVSRTWFMHFFNGILGLQEAWCLNSPWPPYRDSVFWQVYLIALTSTILSPYSSIKTFFLILSLRLVHLHIHLTNFCGMLSIFYFPKFVCTPQQIFISFNRPLYGCEGMLGNQDKMAVNSKVCKGIQSQQILPNWIYLSLSLCKLKLMNLKKLYTKCGVHSSPLSLFRKFDSSMHFL